MASSVKVVHTNFLGINMKKEVLDIESEIDKLIDAENKAKAEQQLLIKQKELDEKGYNLFIVNSKFSHQCEIYCNICNWQSGNQIDI